jgi:hypothetical protein
VRKANTQGSGMCVENRRGKWRGDFKRRMMMFESMIERILMGRDLGMEGRRRGRESARKIYEKGARSGQRNARLHNEGRE